MGDILFISHRIPFPPDRGDKIRSHHVLKRLANIAPVHVATFADDDADASEEVELAALARSYRLVRRAKPLVLAGVQALAARQPVSLSAFHDAELAAYVRDILATCPVSTIYVFSGQMGQYVPAGFTGRVVADFVDVDSAKFEAYAVRRGRAMGWIDAREARMLRDEEARLAARADVSLLISQAEADLFVSRLSARERLAADVRVLGNGIDSELYDPDRVTPEPRLADYPPCRLLFTGQMDYAPNVEASQRVARRILPLVREEVPGASFHVVGRKPAQSLLDLDGKDGVRVWGRVDDVRPWLKAADMALVPLEIARGVQNKVLEAMAMALPVVLTAGAATGIGGENGLHFSMAESDEELAEAVVALHRAPARARMLGQAARNFVVERASWHSVLARLPEIVLGGKGATRDAA